MFLFSQVENPLRMLELFLSQSKLENEVRFRQDDHNITSNSAEPPCICSYSPDSSSMRSTAESVDSGWVPLATSESHEKITISRAPPRRGFSRFVCLEP